MPLPAALAVLGCLAHGARGADVAAAWVEARIVGADVRRAPNWAWRRNDTSELFACLALGGACGTIAAVLLGIAGVNVLRQRRQTTDDHHDDALPAPTWGRRPSVLDREEQLQPQTPKTPTRWCCGRRQQPARPRRPRDVEDALAADALAQAAASPLGGSAPGTPPSCARVAALVVIGFAPLAICALLGGWFRSVLVAMVAMHWGSMCALPSLYYAVDASCGRGGAAIRFYARTWRDLQADTEAKVLRGCILGIPVLVAALAGYVAFRCRTYTWALCVGNFNQPIEEFGLAPHSIPFRLLTAAYFTFWNPAVEEFFWRVFLHHELAEAAGYDPHEERHLVAKDGVGPWRSLLGAVASACPGRAAPLRWGVSAMYASYHLWPIMGVFRSVWWVYAVLGFFGLMCLGRFLLLLREHPQFGIPAAYVLHVWVDAAFAALALFKIHPYELGEEP